MEELSIIIISNPFHQLKQRDVRDMRIANESVPHRLRFPIFFAAINSTSKYSKPESVSHLPSFDHDTKKLNRDSQQKACSAFFFSKFISIYLLQQKVNIYASAGAICNNFRLNIIAL